MSGDDTARAIYLTLFVVLIASSLIARRLPLAQTAKMALTWVAIFFGMFVLFSFRDEAAGIWSRVTAQFNPSQATVSGKTVRLSKSEDGHFWVRAEVNGRTVRFMVDSGATTTAMSMENARAAGVAVDDSGFPVMIETANGVVSARRARLNQLKVGSITRTDFPVLVAPEFGDTTVLGMNFLSSLKSWRVEGDSLVLEP